jgi:hypothetical protein
VFFALPACSLTLSRLVRACAGQMGTCALKRAPPQLQRALEKTCAFRNRGQGKFENQGRPNIGEHLPGPGQPKHSGNTCADVGLIFVYRFVLCRQASSTDEGQAEVIA